LKAAENAAGSGIDQMTTTTTTTTAEQFAKKVEVFKKMLATLKYANHLLSCTSGTLITKKSQSCQVNQSSLEKSVLSTYAVSLDND